MNKETNTINIFNAAWSNDIETVKTYINNGGDVNAKDDDGDTALMWAKNAEMTKLLIDAGADVNARCDRYGSTALMQACCACDAEMIKLLIDAGADVNARIGCCTTLMLAPNAEIKKLLKSHGAVA